VHAKKKVAKCIVVSDSVLHNVGAEHEDMVECFLGIKAEQLNSNR